MVAFSYKKMIACDYQRYNKWLASICVIGMFLTIIINFYVDPLYKIRYPNAFSNVYIHHDRYLFSGLASSYPAELIIIGQSHSQNTKASQAEKIWGYKALNLAVSGSTALEQHIVANAALRTGRIKRVLWEINFATLTGDGDNYHVTAKFPAWLYSNTVVTFAKYVLSFETLNFAMKVIIKKGYDSLDGYNNWQNEFIKRDKLWWKKLPISVIEPQQAKHSIVESERLKNNINKNFVQLIEQYPKTMFEIFIPPFSPLTYNTENAITNFYMRKVLLLLQKKYSNIKIHDFQLYLPIITDLNNYKDIMHFSPEINEFILTGIKSNKFKMCDYERSIYFDKLLRAQSIVIKKYKLKSL